MTAHFEEILRLLTGDVSSAGALPDIAWARAVLAGRQEPAPAEVDSDIAHALIQVLVERGDAQLVAWLAGASHKEIAKSARRALHQLRARKVDVPRPMISGAASAAADDEGTHAPLKELPGLVTFYDGAGYRAVWVPAIGLQGVDLLTTEISRRYGVVSYERRALGRKKYRGIVRRLKEEIQAAPTTAADALWLLYQAVNTNEKSGRALPTNFLPALRELGAPPSGAHPALRIEPSAAEANRIYELKELRTWLPERDFLQRLALRQQEIETSTLFVNEEQRQAQWQEALAQSVRDYFTEAQLEECRQHLLDTAHVFFALNRQADAQALRAAADAFGQERAVALTHPIVVSFVERLFRNGPPRHQTTAGSSPERQTAGGIILP